MPDNNWKIIVAGCLWFVPTHDFLYYSDHMKILFQIIRSSPSHISSHLHHPMTRKPRTEQHSLKLELFRDSIASSTPNVMDRNKVNSKLILICLASLRPALKRKSSSWQSPGYGLLLLPLLSSRSRTLTAFSGDPVQRRRREKLISFHTKTLVPPTRAEESPGKCERYWITPSGWWPLVAVLQVLNHA